MRTTTLALFASFAITFSGMTFLGGAADQAKKTDEERIIGTWVLVKGQERGKELPAEMMGGIKMLFTKDGKLSWEIPVENKGQIELRYKIVGAGQIDLGPDKELSLGIYRFDDDDHVTICFDTANDGKRPTEFASKEGGKQVVFFLERAKPEDKMTREEKAKANAALEKAVEKFREAASRTQSASNLKQIAICFHAYHDAYKALPLPAIFFFKDGRRPLLSWRVTLLPYIEQGALYEQFKLDEPWDSEHNKKLIPKMPSIYAATVDAKKQEGMTFYQIFTGPDAVFDSTKRMTFAQITNNDGLSNTLLVIDAAEPVIWTKPQDLELPRDKGRMPAVGGLFSDRVLMALCDGSIRLIDRPNLAPEILRALVTPNGREPIDWSKLEK